MLIRIGFDIELSVATPMALIYLLHVHPSRRDDLVAPEKLQISGGLQAEEYIDSFGNHCGRVNVPVGMNTVRLTNDALIRDSGQLDEVDPDARQHDPTELPFSTLQFLLPSRYCEVDSELLAFAWNRFGGVAPGTPRVQAICDFVHSHLNFNYSDGAPDADGARRVPRARRRVPRLHPPRDHAVPLHEHPGALHHRLPRRHRRAAGARRRWTSAPGSRSFLGDRWYTFDARTTAGASAASSWRAAATPATCRSRCASARTACCASRS
jgi:hypothetical protein